MDNQKNEIKDLLKYNEGIKEKLNKFREGYEYLNNIYDQFNDDNIDCSEYKGIWDNKSEVERGLKTSHLFDGKLHQLVVIQLWFACIHSRLFLCRDLFLL